MIHRLHWCPMKYRNPLARNDVGSRTASGTASRRLCIVSRDRPLSGAAIAALKATLAPGEDLEIVMDRRDEESSAQLPLIERRHHPDVDLALARDGFALVPTETSRPAAHGSPKLPRAPSTPPVARLVLKDEDARELERVLGFKRRRSALRRGLIPAGLVIGIGILALL